MAQAAATKKCKSPQQWHQPLSNGTDQWHDAVTINKPTQQEWQKSTTVAPIQRLVMIHSDRRPPQVEAQVSHREAQKATATCSAKVHNSGADSQQLATDIQRSTGPQEQAMTRLLRRSAKSSPGEEAKVSHRSTDRSPTIASTKPSPQAEAKGTPNRRPQVALRAPVLNNWKSPQTVTTICGTPHQWLLQ